MRRYRYTPDNLGLDTTKYTNRSRDERFHMNQSILYVCVYVIGKALGYRPCENRKVSNSGLRPGLRISKDPRCGTPVVQWQLWEQGLQHTLLPTLLLAIPYNYLMTGTNVHLNRIPHDVVDSGSRLPCIIRSCTSICDAYSINCTYLVSRNSPRALVRELTCIYWSAIRSFCLPVCTQVVSSDTWFRNIPARNDHSPPPTRAGRPDCLTAGHLLCVISYIDQQ